MMGAPQELCDTVVSPYEALLCLQVFSASVLSVLILFFSRRCPEWSWYEFFKNIHFSFLQDSERAGRHHTGPSAKLQVCSVIVRSSQTHFDHESELWDVGVVHHNLSEAHAHNRSADRVVGLSAVSCAASLTVVMLKIIYGKEL